MGSPKKNVLLRFRFAVLVVVNALAIILTPFDVHALAFQPTELEWVAWPDYCRARYVVSGAGVSSKFALRVSSAEVSYQEQQMGTDAWHYLHHYCAGLVYTKRAATEKDAWRADWLLREAEKEIMSQYTRLNNRDPMFPDVVISIAQVHRARGNFEGALKFLEESMQSQPTASSPYALAAFLYKEAGKIEEALKVLQRGDSAAGGMSAELHYFLGLFYIDINDLDSAERHARRAYELGYPLPGLASKLDRRGRTLN